MGESESQRKCTREGAKGGEWSRTGEPRCELGFRIDCDELNPKNLTKSARIACSGQVSRTHLAEMASPHKLQFHNLPGSVTVSTSDSESLSRGSNPCRATFFFSSNNTAGTFTATLTPEAGVFNFQIHGGSTSLEMIARAPSGSREAPAVTQPAEEVVASENYELPRADRSP